MKKWILYSATAILLAACEKEKKECPGAIEQEFTLTDFSRIKAGGTFSVTIDKGNNYNIKARGCADDIADLDLAVSNSGWLDINYKKFKSGRYRVDLFITVPQLASIDLSGAAQASIIGFGGQPTVIRNILSGASVCTMNGTAINANIELSGSSVLHLSGNTESLYGNITGNANLNSFNTEATEVDINVSGAAKAYVQPVQRFFAEASGDSRIYYKGNPPATNLVTNGNGRIIHE